MKIASLFAGCGGLDLGFKQAGAKIIWANEYDKTIFPTHKLNFPEVTLNIKSICDIDASEVPEIDGLIGGPPCQSWSEAGSRKGILDKRGQLFYEYIRILTAKKPKFFLAENVSGILHARHGGAYQEILRLFQEAGYRLYHQLLNAVDYGVPQDRKRVIIIGVRHDIKREYRFPKAEIYNHLTLKEVISDLKKSARPALEKNKPNPDLMIANHEYMIGGFSPIFMSRNRVRGWDEPSFTIQAGGRQAPIHPSAPKMVKIEKDKFIFSPGREDKYRRLSIRECARIQSFPDDFYFQYHNVTDGYKMIGNAVPVELARRLAVSLYEQIFREG